MPLKQLFWGILLAGLVLGLGLFSLTVGARDIPLSTILASFSAYDGENFQELIIRTLRWPRLLAALLCGSSFAVSGALMQGITNNPMASPSILGINSRASFGMALAMILLPEATLNQTVGFSFLGAAFATGIILLVASRLGGKATPVYLALAGTAISAIFTAATRMLVVFFDVAQDLSYWTAGGLSGIRLEQIFRVGPWTLLGLGIALAISRQVTLLSFGDEVAVGLGAQLGKIRFLAVGRGAAFERFRGGFGRPHWLCGPGDAPYGPETGGHRLPGGTPGFCPGWHLVGAAGRHWRQAGESSL